MNTDSDYVDSMINVIADACDEDALRAKALAYRLRRVAHHLEIHIKRDLARYSIDLWELELLACLKRAPGHQLSAGALMTQMQLTSGAVTNRIKRVEDKGWVTRDVDLSDRRSVLVTLTEEGNCRADHVFAAKTDAEITLLSALTSDRQDQLNDALRTLLISLEGPSGSGD